MEGKGLVGVGYPTSRLSPARIKAFTTDNPAPKAVAFDHGVDGTVFPWAFCARHGPGCYRRVFHGDVNKQRFPIGV
jgi:hypothetical protein